MALGSINRRKAVCLLGSGMLVPMLGSKATFASEQRHRIDVKSRILDVKGKAAQVFGMVVNGSPGALRTRYGKDFSAVVNNHLTEPTLIHWHGLTPPSAQDGVPHLSGPVIDAGMGRSFRFNNNRTGTHWMHSHVGLQEQLLLAAPLIVEEDGAALVDEQEHVVMLHDFSFRAPEELLAELKGGGGLHAQHGGAATDPHAMHEKPAADPHAAHKAGATPTQLHLSDIAFDAMLANDRTLDDPEVVRAEKSGRFRLRVINAAAASNMWIDLGAVQGELIAVDGNSIRPLKGNRFPLAIAQRADIRLQLPSGSGAYPVIFAAEGSALRSGIILQTGNGLVSQLTDIGDVAPALDLLLEPRMVSIAETPDNPVARTDMVMLTGGGADYQWGFNGKSMMHDTLLTVREGERYELMIHNMTNMAHPMHLHGHYFRVVGIGSQRFKGAIRDTILIPPNQMVTIQFDADNPGSWAFHCHHLYHMNSGMMAAISYSGAA